MRVFQNVHMLLDEGICSFFKGRRGELFCGAKNTAISGGYRKPGGESRARRGAPSIGISQLGARRGGMQSLTGPGGIMIDQIQEKRMGPRLSVLGILALCLIFWAAFVTLVLNW